MNTGIKIIRRKANNNMKKQDLENIILEAYQEVLIESSIEERDDLEADPETRKLKDYPKSFISSLEKRYGPVNLEHDFISSNGETYFKFTSKNKSTGSIAHKVIALPSFENLFRDFSDIIMDIKKLMNSADVRQDKAARELFELIKTNFRKLQRYLRVERPDQYQLMKLRRVMEMAVEGMKKKYPSPDMLSEINDKDPKPEETRRSRCI